MRRHAGARGLRRDYRRRPARGRLRNAARAYRRARPAGRTAQVVPRSEALWLGAARRVRDGNRAGGGMALRAASYPRDDPVPADDGTAGAVGFDRAFPFFPNWANIRLREA